MTSRGGRSGRCHFLQSWLEDCVSCIYNCAAIMNSILPAYTVIVFGFLFFQGFWLDGDGSSALPKLVAFWV